MAVKIHHYIYKNADQQWNKGKDQLSPFQRIAWNNWNKYCIEVQPGWVSTTSSWVVDANTRCTTYELDMLSENYVNPYALNFWKNIHDINNEFYAAWKKCHESDDPEFTPHKFKVTLEKDGVETDIIPLPSNQ
jgi:hypothetical protein